MVNIKKYIEYFVIGGLLSLFGLIIIENFENGPALSSYLYGGLPTLYLLLMWISYNEKGKEGYDTFIVHSLINCGIFYIILVILFLLTYFNRTNFNIYNDFIIATIIFIFLSIIYFKKFFKRKFIFNPLN